MTVQTPQKIAVLQISSSLDWRSIKRQTKPCSLSRNRTPPTSITQEVSRKRSSRCPRRLHPGTIDLDIAYEGVILLDATRLTRIGTPEDVARSTDWDEIGTTFSAVRGAGYVAWYPIADRGGESFRRE